MASLRNRPLSKRIVDALEVGQDTVYWDSTLKGFGVRVYPSGARIYVVQTRGPGGTKRVTVGRHGVITTDEARRRAASIVARIKAGEAPSTARAARAQLGPTVAELAGRYLREHVAVHCKPATAKAYRYLFERHIVPALGKLSVGALDRRHVSNLHYKMRNTPCAANEAIAALSRMLNRVEAWGLAPAGGNPCRHVVKYRQRRLERFLTEEEFRRIGRTLAALEAEGRVPVHAAAALRLLMLTGCRCNEILTLRWDDVHLDTREIRLRDSKTGPRVVALSPAAGRVLEGLPRAAGNPWVVAGRRPGTRLKHLAYYWYQVREPAGLGDVRLHDLRHSFASRALALGESLPMIGKLLGHTKIQTTARYAHLARDSIGESAARVAASIGADVMPEILATTATRGARAVR